MSFGDYQCPLAASLEQPAELDCNFNMWQIQKMWIYREDGGVPFATIAAAQTAATVTPLFAAVDDTKFISTPFIENLEIPTADEITEGGGDNSTVDGQEIVVGMGPITVSTPMIREVTPEIVKSLKLLNGEPRLRVIFVNEFGNLIADVFDGTQVRGFKLNSLTFKEPQRMGKNTNDKMPFRFGLNYGWADNAQIIVPSDYDAKNDY